MDHIFTAACLAAPVIVYGVYHRYTHISLANIPGSKSASFILGTSISLSPVPSLAESTGESEIDVPKINEADLEPGIFAKEIRVY
jgi:hypothetical protein